MTTDGSRPFIGSQDINITDPGQYQQEIGDRIDLAADHGDCTRLTAGGVPVAAIVPAAVLDQYERWLDTIYEPQDETGISILEQLYGTHSLRIPKDGTAAQGVPAELLGRIRSAAQQLLHLIDLFDIPDTPVRPAGHIKPVRDSDDLPG